MSGGSTAETSGRVRMNISTQIEFCSLENVKVSVEYFSEYLAHSVENE